MIIHDYCGSTVLIIHDDAEYVLRAVCAGTMIIHDYDGARIA